MEKLLVKGLTLPFTGLPFKMPEKPLGEVEMKE
jgi:hypothetical protein